MNEFFGSVWWLIISLGILVTFHEFGHFWVARRFGVRVLRFSVGFGKPLWKRLGKNGTEYVVAAIPLGGYVKFLDGREGEVAPEQRHEAFDTKSVGQRFAIVAAGPLFNLLLALLLLWAMFVIGKGDYQPLVGRAEGIAASAGLYEGDRLLTVSGEQVPTWTHAAMRLATAALDHKAVEVTAQASDGSTHTALLDLSQLPAGTDETTALRHIGLTPRHYLLEAVIGEIAKNSPADGVLQIGDRIVSIAGEPVRWFDEITSVLQRHAANDYALEIKIERAGNPLIVSIQPQWDGSTQPPRWVLGLRPQTRNALPHDAVLRYGPIGAIGATLRETWWLTESSFGMLGRMLTGTASLKNLSGPISIAQFAHASAQMGVAWFLSFLALLSLSLCIMNLLPIPILDGGHLVYYLIEMIKGSPVSERVLAAGQYIGLAMLIGLMGLAFYNDIMRLIS